MAAEKEKEKTNPAEDDEEAKINSARASAEALAASGNKSLNERAKVTQDLTAALAERKRKRGQMMPSPTPPPPSSTKKKEVIITKGCFYVTVTDKTIKEETSKRCVTYYETEDKIFVDPSDSAFEKDGIRLSKEQIMGDKALINKMVFQFTHAFGWLFKPSLAIQSREVHQDVIISAKFLMIKESSEKEKNENFECIMKKIAQLEEHYKSGKSLYCFDAGMNWNAEPVGNSMMSTSGKHDEFPVPQK